MASERVISGGEAELLGVQTTQESIRANGICAPQNSGDCFSIDTLKI